MPLFSKSKYISLEGNELPEYDGFVPHSKPKMEVRFSWLVTALLATIPITSVTTLFLNNAVHSNQATAHVACMQPTIRREWRTLSRADRSAYIDAVKCLSTQPSMLRDNGTAYDDFPWVHQKTAPTAHKSAPFLPWHRYYIHSYETALKQQCGFTGALPYWDWSQDVGNFEGAPIWDSVYGFGGNGAEKGSETVGNGRCVVDGPFAGTQAMFYADEDNQHCLSRGWAQGDELRQLTGLVHPHDLEDLMKEADFATFAPELERRAHTFISRSIGGDFSKYTGPYDPVFFLHHANLDRIWAQWQAQHDPMAYAGKASMYDSAAASIHDELNVGGLLSNVPASEVFSTTSNMFCYQY